MSEVVPVDLPLEVPEDSTLWGEGGPVMKVLV